MEEVEREKAKRERERKVSFFFVEFFRPTLKQSPLSKEKGNRNSPIFSAPQAHLGAQPQSAMVDWLVFFGREVLVGRKKAVFFFFEEVEVERGRWKVQPR